MNNTLYPIFLAILITPTMALAGNFSDQTYTSHLGYTVKAPDGWTRVDAAIIDAVKDTLPKNISPKALERADVIFYPAPQTNTPSADENSAPNPDETKDAPKPAAPADKKIDAKAQDSDPAKDNPGTDSAPSTAGNDTPDFVPTISILALDYAPSSTSDDTLKAYADELSTRLSRDLPDLQDFKLISSATEPLANVDAQIFKYTYTHNSVSLTVEQAMVVHNQKVFLITCTQLSDDQKRYCRPVLNSMKF